MDSTLDASTEKLRREVKSLLDSAKESKIISQCVSVDKVRKSRRDFYEANVGSPQSGGIVEKSGRSRASSNNSSCSDLSTKNTDSKRSMRSQNVEFVMKHKKFMKAFTGRTTPDVAEDESGKTEPKELLPIASVIDNLGRTVDPFCWNCHRDGSQLICSLCPRTFHSKCLPVKVSNNNSGEGWACPECVNIMNADNTDNRSPAMRRLTLSKLTNLLKYALNRMESVVGCEPFIDEVNPELFPQYGKYIVNPMNMKKLRENVTQAKYGSTCAFVADARWILHNSIIFNTSQAKLTTVAKNIMKVCRREMNEIETCPECYHGANTRLDWFVQVCPKPHLLLWAKLKGFPYWPAKAMAVSNTGLVDVRFFGAHDKAWLKPSECYLYSKQDPNCNNKQRKNEIIVAVAELNIHLEKLELKWGPFKPAPFKTPYSPQSDEASLKLMLPNFVPNEGIKNGPIVVPCSPDEKSKSNSSSTRMTSNTSSPSPHKDTFNMQPKVVLTAFTKKLGRNVFTEGYDTEDEEAVLEETGNIVKSDSSANSTLNISHLYEPDLEIGEVISTYQRSKLSNKTRPMPASRKLLEAENRGRTPGKRISRSKSVCITSFEPMEESTKSPTKSGSIDSNDPEKLVLEFTADNETDGVGKRKRTLSDAGSLCKKVKNSANTEAAKPATPVQSKLRSRGKSVDTKLMMSYREALEKKKLADSASKSAIEVEDLNTSDEITLHIDDTPVGTPKPIEVSSPIASTPVEDVLKESAATEVNTSAVTKEGSTPVVDKSPSLPGNDDAVSIPEDSERNLENVDPSPIIPDGLEHVSIQSVVSMNANSSSLLKDVLKAKSPKKQNNDPVTSPTKDVPNPPSKSPEKVKSPNPSLTTSETISNEMELGEISEDPVILIGSSDSDTTLNKSSDDVGTNITELENDAAKEKADDSTAAEAVSPRHNTKNYTKTKTPSASAKSPSASEKSSNASEKSPSASAKSPSESGSVSPKTLEQSLEQIRQLSRQNTSEKPTETIVEVPIVDSELKEEPLDYDEVIRAENNKTHPRDKETFVNSLSLRPNDSSLNNNNVTKSSQPLTRNMTNNMINGQSNALRNSSIKQITLSKKSPSKSPEKSANGATIIKKTNDIIKTVEAVPRSIAEKVLSPSRDVIMKKSVLKSNESPVILMKQIANKEANGSNKRKTASPSLAVKKYKNVNGKDVVVNAKQIVNKTATNGNIGVKVMALQGKNIFRIVNSDGTTPNMSLLAKNFDNSKQLNNTAENETQQLNNNIRMTSELNVSNSMVYIPSDPIYTQHSPPITTQSNTDNVASDLAANNSGVQIINGPPPLILNNGNGNVLLRPVQTLMADSQPMDTSPPATTTTTTAVTPGTVRVVPQAYLLNTPVTTSVPAPNTITNTNINVNVESPSVDNCPPINKSIPPNNAGMVSKILNDSAFKMGEYFRHLLEESINSVGSQSGSLEAQVFSLKAQLEKLRWQHMVKLRELKHNTEIQIKEIRACLESEKHRAVQEAKKLAEIEKIQAVNETKKKEWCKICGREANLYCCRNAMYCDNPCQQAHWLDHITNCLRAEEHSNIQRAIHPGGMTPTSTTAGSNLNNTTNNRKHVIIKQVSTTTAPANFKNAISLLSTTPTSPLPAGFKLVPTSSVISNSILNAISSQTSAPSVIFSQQITNTDTTNAADNVHRITLPQADTSVADNS